MISMANETKKSLYSEHRLEKYIIHVLSVEGKLTTKELVARAEADGRTCPDEPVRF